MEKYFRTPLDSDLSNTSCRCRKDIEGSIYIEYNEGFVGDDWVEVPEEEIKMIASEWFVFENMELTQLDRIESAVSNTLDEIRAEAVDEYTLSLMENNII